jgi:hypothetical protein
VLSRWTSICAVLGGLLWAVACSYRATLPPGCVGDACLVRSMRGDTPLGSALFGAAALLLLGAGAGLLLLVHRHTGLGRLGLVGLVAAATGVALLAAALVLVVLLAVVDDDVMPRLVVPGVALVALGGVLVAVVLVRSPLLPRWAAVALLVGAALLVLANEQDARVLLAVPFGLAWVVVGLGLRRPARAAAGGHRSAPRSAPRR